MEEIILKLFGENNFLATIIASMFPVIEARGAVPFALSCTFWEKPLSIGGTFFACLLGSFVATLILLIFLQPLLDKLKKLKFVNSLYLKLQEKVDLIENEKHLDKKSNISKYIFLVLFTALPIPLTGYYTASVVASFLKFDKIKSLICITLGNLISITLMILISLIASEYITIIFYFFVIAFIITIVYLLFH